MGRYPFTVRLFHSLHLAGFDRRTARHAAIALATLIWGSTFLAISIGNDTVAPVWAAALRLALAAVLLGALALARRQRLPRGGALRSAALFGFFQFGVNFPLLYWAETKVPSGLAAVIFATIPLDTAILARVFGLERLTAPKIAGALLALAGIAMIFSAQITLDVDAAHFLATLGGAWAASLGSVLLKRGPRSSPIAVNLVAAASGFAVCCAVSLLVGERQELPASLPAILPIAYLAVAASVGAFTLWAWLLHHSDVTKLSYMAVVTPLVALVLGILLRGERLAPASFAGAFVVLGGVLLGVRVPKATATRAGKAPVELAPPAAGE